MAINHLILTFSLKKRDRAVRQFYNL